MNKYQRVLYLAMMFTSFIGLGIAFYMFTIDLGFAAIFPLIICGFSYQNAAIYYELVKGRQ